jgi:HK97 gp10 family phage protein
MSVEVIKYGDAEKGADEGTIEAILTTCIMVTSEAKSLAPVDMGLLRNSIMYKTGAKSGGNSDGRELTVEPKVYEGYVGSNTEYATYQEFGTFKMEAQPYLRPAVINTLSSSDYSKLVSKILNDEMTKAIRTGKKVL